MRNDTPLKISVIVPVYNGGDQLEQCLRAISASQRSPDKVIVVDDGSSDDSGRFARELGFELLVLPDGPQGPARARNRGVSSAPDCDILVFIDADVVVHADTLGRMEEYFQGDPNVAALFGSYDSNPVARNAVSLYKNLLNHHVHQVSQAEASTFWAGCGAIRREAFEAIGGFDEAYRHPSIEDIELGVRLRKGGYRILLRPDVQSTHLKKWTFGQLLYTDIFRRALPWSRLISEQGQLLNDLNLSFRHRVAALAAVAFIAAALLALWSPLSAFIVVAVSLTVFVVLNFDLFVLFVKTNGIGFAVIAAGLHLLYYLYSTGAIAWVMAGKILKSMFGPLVDRVRRIVRGHA